MSVPSSQGFCDLISLLRKTHKYSSEKKEKEKEEENGKEEGIRKRRERMDLRVLHIIKRPCEPCNYPSLKVTTGRSK